nr:ADP-ribosylglycohydrolase family protein [Candidatus Njordarchaeota archaeon]
AHDATALLAATVSAAMSEKKGVEEILETAIKTNPFGFRYRRMTDESTSVYDCIDVCHHIPTLPRFFKIAEKSKDEKELMLKLAKECEYLHPSDPLDCLGIALTVIRYHKGDPVRSIVSAANHRRVDENGRLVTLRDVDCIAGVAGAIVGAVNGISGFPKDWIRDVVEANRKVYNIDIEKNARDFYLEVYQ